MRIKFLIYYKDIILGNKFTICSPINNNSLKNEIKFVNLNETNINLINSNEMKELKEDDSNNSENYNKKKYKRNEQI